MFYSEHSIFSLIFTILSENEELILFSFLFYFLLDKFSLSYELKNEIIFNVSSVKY